MFKKFFKDLVFAKTCNDNSLYSFIILGTRIAISLITEFAILFNKLPGIFKKIPRFEGSLFSTLIGFAWYIR